MDEIEKRLIEGNPWKLNGTEGFTYVGQDDYGIPGWDQYLFACVIEDSGAGNLPKDLWIYPIEKELLSIEENNITNKEGRSPFHRMRFLDERHAIFSNKISVGDVI
ncbi:MAG: hypothetical protein PVJ67_01115 [Candidatus Pacearchaeota archaeon]|jgi:hypothetical protein